jgi:hypothetical protein
LPTISHRAVAHKKAMTDPKDNAINAQLKIFGCLLNVTIPINKSGTMM